VKPPKRKRRRTARERVLVELLHFVKHFRRNYNVGTGSMGEALDAVIARGERHRLAIEKAVKS
jgi:hypothetical protein